MAWKGITKKEKVETKVWYRVGGCGFGLLSLEPKEYIHRSTCRANPVFPEDAHRLWGEPI